MTPEEIKKAHRKLDRIGLIERRVKRLEACSDAAATSLEHIDDLLSDMKKGTTKSLK